MNKYEFKMIAVRKGDDKEQKRLMLQSNVLIIEPETREAKRVNTFYCIDDNGKVFVQYASTAPRVDTRRMSDRELLNYMYGSTRPAYVEKTYEEMPMLAADTEDFYSCGNPCIIDFFNKRCATRWNSGEGRWMDNKHVIELRNAIKKYVDGAGDTVSKELLAELPMCVTWVKPEVLHRQLKASLVQLNSLCDEIDAGEIVGFWI